MPSVGRTRVSGCPDILEVRFELEFKSKRERERAESSMSALDEYRI